jgi:lysophospholipase L1-like esterase/mannose-6-phosphate isomerase-like protein (cupin superfamily)
VEGTRVVVALGDSITAGNPGWDPDPLRRAAEGDDPTSQWCWWAERAHPGLRFRNCGVGGERTDEIAGRLEASVAGGADVLVVQGGINDVVQGRPVEEAARDLGRMVRRGQELELQVLVAEVLPWNNGWPAAEPAIRRLNELIRELGDEAGVGVLPFHESLEDPDRPGRMRADWTADGNHPSVAGHRRLGERAFAPPRPRWGVAHLSTIPTTEVAPGFGLQLEGEWRQIRAHFGIREFSANAFVATEAGQQIVHTHVEEPNDPAHRRGDEELYLVLSGRAVAQLGEERVEAPAGTLVFVGDPATRRSFTAAEAGTTVLAFGTNAGVRFVVSAFEREAGRPPRFR